MPIRIRSKRHGFRRCGMAHPSDWVNHPDGRFAEDQIARLKAEPMLQVEIVEGEDDGEEPESETDTEDSTDAEDEVLDAWETGDGQTVVVRGTGEPKSMMPLIVEASKEAAKAGQVTKDGKPTVEAVEAILGTQITAGQRDQAWEIIQAETGAGE